jgi:hypothetical protein
MPKNLSVHIMSNQQECQTASSDYLVITVRCLHFQIGFAFLTHKIKDKL